MNDFDSFDASFEKAQRSIKILAVIWIGFVISLVAFLCWIGYKVLCHFHLLS